MVFSKPMNPLLNLAEEWRTHGEMLARYGDKRGATACDLHARQLAAAWAEWQSETLTIAQVATDSGYSQEHLRRLVREEEIPNAGRPNAPRIRRADVPKKPGRLAVRRDAQLSSNGYNVDEDARDIAKRLGR